MLVGHRRSVICMGVPGLLLALIALSLILAMPALAGSPAAPSAQEATTSPAQGAATPAPGGSSVMPGLQGGTVPPTPSAPLGPPDALAGRQTYAQSCAACHGDTGAGDGPSASQLGVPPAAFADPRLVAGLSPADLFKTTKNGRMARMMPPWNSRLNDQQIWDVVGYVWTLHTSADEVARGKPVYEAHCADCHGIDGKGKPPALDFTDFKATAAISQTMWAQVVAIGRGTMPAFGQKLSATDQQAALEYVRSLSFKQEFRGALALGPGVITGTVTNGTTGQPMPNLKMTLRIFDGTDPLESRDTNSDALGNYRFQDLPTDAGLTFAVTTQYPAGFPYGTDLTGFPAGQTGLSMPVQVYETTPEAAGLRADRVHFIVEFDQGRLLVAELIVFSLDGNHTYVGDGKGVLHVTLPAGAQELTISDGTVGERYQLTEDGFIDTLPLPPGNGSRQLLYRYSLPYTAGSFDLKRTLPYPAANVNALISDQGEKVASAELVNQGVRQTQNGDYISLVGTNVAANQAISLKFTNMPSPDSLAANANTTADTSEPVRVDTGRTLLYVVIGMLVVLAIFLGVWPILMRRRGAVAGAMAGWGIAGAAESLGEREALVDALARLDLAHQSGEVADSPYREQRLRLKAQLTDVLRRERPAATDGRDNDR